MSFRQRGSFGRRFRGRPRPVIDSNKNIVSELTAVADGVKNNNTIAEAQDSAALAVTQDVERGCSIRAIWIEFWISATEEIAVGVTNAVDLYFWKNPGSNLTSPTPGTTGSSNEKKFILKQWKGLVGARSLGFQPYTWKGWIKIPKSQQRMAANDLWQIVIRPTGTNIIFCHNYIYKWYK